MDPIPRYTPGSHPPVQVSRCTSELLLIGVLTLSGGAAELQTNLQTNHAARAYHGASQARIVATEIRNWSTRLVPDDTGQHDIHTT